MSAEALLEEAATMVAGAEAAAGALESSKGKFDLFPPRDKAAKRLWHELNKFKKDNGKRGADLQLPPESGFVRLCRQREATASQPNGTELSV